MSTWSDRWLAYGLVEAEMIARMSKDPSTQCGAAVLRSDKTVAAKGYNGFPRDVSDEPELYFDRDEKYKRVIHCEMNAILSAREPLDGYTLFTWPFLTCERCAVHVIQSGVKLIVAPRCEGDLARRWGESFALASALYGEAGVEVILTNPVPRMQLISQSELLRARFRLTDDADPKRTILFAHDDLERVDAWMEAKGHVYEKPVVFDSLKNEWPRQ